MGPGHQILREVADKHAITLAELLGDRRTNRVAHPRQEAMWRLRAELGWSFPRIGQLLKRDHTTIIHGIRRYEGRAGLSTIFEIEWKSDSPPFGSRQSAPS